MYCMWVVSCSRGYKATSINGHEEERSADVQGWKASMNAKYRTRNV